MGHISSEAGVQQGDPLGPLLFALVLQKIITTINADDECLHILFQVWYLDDGVLAGSKSAILHALFLLDTLGPSLGIFVNLAKYQQISPTHAVLKCYPPQLSSVLQIGDYIFCANYVALKCTEAAKLLTMLEEVWLPQILR